jgi:hypothetical protein
MTPEGRVKNQINKVLAKYTDIYKFMPVPSGFGKSSLDYVLCVQGMFVAIEAKAPGKKPTDRQDMIAAQIMRAGGKVFVVDGPDTLRPLIEYLEAIHVTCQGKREAQNGGSTVRPVCAEPIPDSQTIRRV